MKTRILHILLFLVFGLVVHAQVTTSSMVGKVTDDKGEALIGATILVTHTPSGTEYGTITDENGQYNISNMRVGGPYNVVFSYVGYANTTESEVYLSLGQAYVLDKKLSEEGIELSEIVVTGTKDNILNSKRTGASTNISKIKITW